MKPVYWIAIMPVIGAVVTYALFRDASPGTVVGIVIGVILYANLSEKKGEGR